MSRTTCSRGAQNRASISESKKSEILAIVAKRARLMPADELQALLPGWRGPERSYLRNAKPVFGWERILYAAERLGVRIELSISEAA